MDSTVTSTPANEPEIPDFLRPGAAPAEDSGYSYNDTTRLHWNYGPRSYRINPDGSAMTPAQSAKARRVDADARVVWRFERVGLVLASPFIALAAIPAAPAFLLVFAAQWLGKRYVQRATRSTE